MRVLHVVPSFYPAHVYGGPIEITHKLCLHLSALCCEVRVLTTDANGAGAIDVPNTEDVTLAPNFSVRYCRRVARDAVSPQLLAALPSAIRWADVVHLTAVYSFTTIPTLMLCRLIGKPVVWSPQGSLKRWEGSSHTVAKSVWERSCRVIAPRSLLLHCTSEDEALESEARLRGVPSVVVRSGVDVPGLLPPRRRSTGGPLRFLFLGRLDPIKGIENLLDACGRLQHQNDLDWRLTIVGAGDPLYERSIAKRIRSAGLVARVDMAGSVTPEQRSEIFRRADVSIVPSHTESFGMVVAESLAHAVPVVASKGTPWSRVEDVGCGRWVSNDPDSLAEAMRDVSTRPLEAMGERGRDWMKIEFGWPVIAARMREVYFKLLSADRSSP